MTDLVSRRKTAAPFAKGNSAGLAGRPPASAKMRKILEPRTAALIRKCADMAEAGDMTAMKIILDRIVPVPRAESQKVLIPGLSEAVTLTDKANVIGAAMGQGLISPDVFVQLTGALGALAKVSEVDELRRRIEELEARRTLRAV